MQGEINGELDANDLRVEIFGVNKPGEERDNALMTAGRAVPWLQDTPEEGVWSDRWIPVWRDVVILDPENRFLGKYNLTEHNLGNAADYATLKARLLALAKRD